MKTRRTLVTALVAAVALAGCGGDEEPAEPTDPATRNDEPEQVDEAADEVVDEVVDEVSWKDEANDLCSTMLANVEQVAAEYPDDTLTAAVGVSAELAELAVALEALQVADEDRDAVDELSTLVATSADALADASTEDEVEMATLEFGVAFVDQSEQLGLDSCTKVIESSDPVEDGALEG